MMDAYEILAYIAFLGAAFGLGYMAAIWAHIDEITRDE